MEHMSSWQPWIWRSLVTLMPFISTCFLVVPCLPCLLCPLLPPTSPPLPLHPPQCLCASCHVPPTLSWQSSRPSARPSHLSPDPTHSSVKVTHPAILLSKPPISSWDSCWPSSIWTNKCWICAHSFILVLVLASVRFATCNVLSCSSRGQLVQRLITIAVGWGLSGRKNSWICAHFVFSLLLLVLALVRLASCNVLSFLAPRETISTETNHDSRWPSSISTYLWALSRPWTNGFQSFKSRGCSSFPSNDPTTSSHPHRCHHHHKNSKIIIIRLSKIDSTRCFHTERESATSMIPIEAHQDDFTWSIRWFQKNPQGRRARNIFILKNL